MKGSGVEIFTEGKDKLDQFCANQINNCACSKLEEVVHDVSYEHNMKSIDYMYEWVDTGFKPPNLSIIDGCNGSMKFIEVGQMEQSDFCWSRCSFKAYYTDWY